MSEQQTPPGWYPDPSGSGGQRYWDGAQWTDQVQAPAATGGPPPIVPLSEQRTVTVSPPPPIWLAVPISFALLLIGCIGPWIKSDIPGVEAGGLEKDGSLILVVGVIAAVLLTLWRQNGKGYLAWIAAGLSALNVLVAIIDLGDFDDVEGLADPGWGLYLTLVGAIAMAVISVVLALNRRRS